MSYSIAFHPGALREFDKLPKEIQKNLAQVIDELANDPRPQGVVKLMGIDAYRMRAGQYRIAYAIQDERLIVLIVKVGHRREIYKEIETIRHRLKN